MAKQITKPARGDAPNTGTPVTVAPTKKWNPSTNPRQFAPSYGSNLDPSPSSVEGARSSPLADELKSVNARSDAGDELQRIIERGSARNSMVDLQSLQIRPYSLDQTIPTSSKMVRQTEQSSRPGDVKVGELPKTLGASAAQPVRKPS